MLHCDCPNFIYVLSVIQRKQLSNAIAVIMRKLSIRLYSLSGSPAAVEGGCLDLNIDTGLWLMPSCLWKPGSPNPEQKTINRVPNVTDQTYFSEREKASINLVLNRKRDESGFWRNYRCDTEIKTTFCHGIVRNLRNIVSQRTSTKFEVKTTFMDDSLNS